MALTRRCPICGRRMLRFAQADPASPDRGLCRGCGSYQRHRLLWLYLTRRLALGSAPLRVLHFAPEAGIERRLRATPGVDYLSGDLEPGRADRELDLCAELESKTCAGLHRHSSTDCAGR